MCGPHTISFNLLSEAIVALLFNYTFASVLNKEAIFGLHLESTQSMAVARMIGNNCSNSARQKLARETRTLKKLLLATRSNSATDPRDKIFALLGLATQKGSLEADCSKSVAEVYIEAAWTLTRETQSLEVLTLTSSTHRVEDLPSWVPDWRKPCSLLLAVSCTRLHCGEKAERNGRLWRSPRHSTGLCCWARFIGLVRSPTILLHVAANEA